MKLIKLGQSIGLRVNKQSSIDCVWFWVHRLHNPKYLGTCDGYQIRALNTSLWVMESMYVVPLFNWIPGVYVVFSIYLTEIKFKKIFKLSTVTFPRNLPVYKIEYLFIILQTQWWPSLIFLLLFIHLPVSLGNSSINNTLPWLPLKTFLQFFSQGFSYSSDGNHTNKGWHLCPRSLCTTQVGHVLYLDLTSHFCSHHCGQLNKSLVQSQLTGRVPAITTRA